MINFICCYKNNKPSVVKWLAATLGLESAKFKFPLTMGHDHHLELLWNIPSLTPWLCLQICASLPSTSYRYCRIMRKQCFSSFRHSLALKDPPGISPNCDGEHTY